MGPTTRTRKLALLVVSLLVAGAACNSPADASKNEDAVRPAEGTPASTVVAPSAAAKPVVFDESFLKNEPKKYSQFREEVIIRHYFKDKRGGFFLDVGAAEPEIESTTHYLAQELGWKGVAIDARAELAEQYAKTRPGTKFFANLVTDHSGTQETLYSAGRLSSGNKDHLAQFGAKDAKPREVEVPSITLNDLLTREKVEHIDFMNMDIEGFEPPALAGFDIDKYQPTLVCIESAPKTREAIMKYFTDHGYRRMDELFPYDHVNWYFEKKKA